MGMGNSKSSADEDFTLQRSSQSKDVKQKPEKSEYISNEQNISENTSISLEEIAVRPDYPASYTVSNASSLCETITSTKNEQRDGLKSNALDSKILFFNHTCKFVRGWYCFLCAKTLLEVRYVGAHFEETDHQNLRKMAGETVELKDSKSYRKLVNQGYTPGPDGGIDCIMCDTKGLRTRDMKGHRNSQKHQTNLATFRAWMAALKNAKNFRDKESDDDSSYSEDLNFKIVETHSEKRKHNSDENSGFHTVMPERDICPSSTHANLMGGIRTNVPFWHHWFHISSESTSLLTSASKIAVEKKDYSNQKIIITEKDVVPENIPDFMTLFHNHTCKFGASYYCFMCQGAFISLCAVVSHFEDTDHQQRVNAAFPSFNLSDKADSISSELLVTEGFSPSWGALHTMIECRICDCSCTVSYFEKHIESRSHVKKRVKFSANIVKYKKNVEIELSNLIEASPSESNKTVPALEDSNTNEIVFASNIRLPQSAEKNNEKIQNVTASKISVQEQKIDTTARLKTSFDGKISSAQSTSSNEQHEETIANNPSSTDKMFFANYIIRLCPGYYCFLCEKTFPRHGDASSHINESDHKNRKQITLPAIRVLPKTYTSFIDRGLVPGEKQTVDCKMCGITGLEINMINEHCRSTSHKETKLKFIAGVTESGEKLTSNPGESTLKIKEQVAAITDEIVQSEEMIQGHCSICIVDVVDVSRHDEEPEHKRYLDSFNIAFINLDQQIWCKKCICKIEWSSIKYHAEMHELSPWYKTIPKDDNETLFNNYISKYGTIYYCFICEKSFDHWDKVVLHIKAIGHKNYMESTDQSIDPTTPKCSYRIDEGIVPGQHKLVDCRLCRISFLEGFDISLHLKTTDHIRKKTKFITDLKKSVESKDSPDLENKNPNVSSVVTRVLSIQPIENQTAMNKNCSEKSKDFVGKQETDATSSKTSIKETKLKFIAGVTESGEKLTSNPGESTLKIKEQVAAITDEIVQSEEMIQGHCSICIVDVVDVSRHNEEPEHKRYLDSFNIAFINLDQQIWCKKCICKIEWSSIKYHAEMHELSPWYKTIPKDDNETLFNNYISKYGTIYYCFICEKSFDHWDKVVLHIKAIGHKNYMESTDQSIDPTMPKCSYRIDEGIVPGQHKLVDCRLCRISFLEGFDISLHLKTTDHIRKKTKFIADLKKSVENKDSPDLENQNPNISSVVTQALSIQEIENQTAMNKNCSEKSKDFVGKQETGASSSKTSIKENFCDAESTSNDKQCEQTVTENTIATAEMFFANYTVKLNPIYYCFLCDKPSMNGGDATAHINESDHQDRKRIACPSAVGWLSVTYLRLIERGLVPGVRNSVDCRMCGITGLKLSDIYIHGGRAQHRNARREFTAAVTESVKKREKFTSDFPNQVMSIYADFVSVYSRISELRSEMKPHAPETDGIIQWTGANEGNCLVCVVDLDDVSAHLSGTQHKQYLRCFNWAFSVVDRQVWCRLCNCNFEWSAIKSHGKMHKLWCYSGAKPDNKTLFDNYIFHHRSTYYCFLCEEIFPTWSHLVPHFGDIDHQHRTKINGQPISLTKNEYSVTTKQGFVPGYSKTIDCRLCCVGGFNIKDLKKQPHSIEHVYNKAKFLTRIGEDGDTEISEDEDRDAETVDTGKSTSSIEDRITKKTIFRNYTSLFPNGLYCFLCEKIIKSWKAVESHFREIDHQMRRIEKLGRNRGTEEPNKANYSVLITHGLVPWQHKRLACKICSKVSVKGYMNHIKANTHVKNLANFVVTFENQNSQSFGGEDFNSESSKKPCNLDETLDQIRREQTMITNFAQRNLTVEEEIEKNYSDPTENVSVDGERCKVALSMSIVRKLMFYNHTIKAGKHFYCYLCEIVLESWDTATLHFNQIDHQNRRDKIGRINQKLDAKQYFMLISNGFVPGPGKRMNCTVCDETGFTKANFINHTQLPVHRKNISMAKMDGWIKKNQHSDSDSIDNEPSRYKPTNAETPKNIHVPYNRNMICNFNLQEEEMMEKTNSEKDPKDSLKTPLADVTGLSNNSEFCIYIQKTNGKKSFCHICSETQFTVATQKIDIHIESLGHRRALTRYGCDKVIRTSNGTYYCICCECGLSSRASVYLHVKDKKHISSVVKVCTGQKVSTGTRRNETPKISDDFSSSSSYNSREFRKSSIPSNFGGETNNDQSRTISDGINCPSQSRFDNYVAKQNVEIAASQTTENSCNALGGRKNTKQSELSTMMSSIASELSRFNLSCDTPAEKNTKKKKRRNIKNKTEEKMAKKEKCPCIPCNFVAQDITQLHIHMATHYAEEFVDYPRNLNDDYILQTCIGGDQIPLAMNSNEPESDAEKIVDNVDNYSVCSEHSFSDSSDSPSSAVETRKSIKRTRKERRAEAKFKDVMKHLEFKDDYIYDLDDKLADLELGMALGLVIDSSNMYCLICRKLVENTVDNYTEHLRDIDHCNYLDEMEMDDAQFVELDEQYSDLDLAQEYIEEISEDTVRCIVCDEDIANNNSSLGAHINHEIHERKCEDTQAIARRRFEETKLGINCDWYSIEKYWCVPCKRKTSSEVSFVEHLGKKKHAKTIRHPDRIGKRMMIDYCPCCSVLWYGYRCTHYYHINSDTHKWLERDGTNNQRYSQKVSSTEFSIKQSASDPTIEIKT